MMKFQWIRLVKEELAQDMIEYALLAGMAAALAVALSPLSTKISAAYGTVSTQLASAGSGAPGNGNGNSGTGTGNGGPNGGGNSGNGNGNGGPKK